MTTYKYEVDDHGYTVEKGTVEANTTVEACKIIANKHGYDENDIDDQKPADSMMFWTFHSDTDLSVEVRPIKPYTARPAIRKCEIPSYYCVKVVAKMPLIKESDAVSPGLKSKVAEINEKRKNQTYEGFFDHINGEILPRFSIKILTDKVVAEAFVSSLNEGLHKLVLSAKLQEFGPIDS